MDRRTEPKVAKGPRAWGVEGTTLEAGVGFLFGPKGRRERKERKVGMLEGLLGVFGGTEGDEATARLSELLSEMLLVDTRGAEGIAEAKALRFGCVGLYEDWGERWVAICTTKFKRTNEREYELLCDDRQ